MFDPLAAPPLLTAALPGIGGRIKTEPHDFEVEELPAYQPSGEGDFLYLWIEKIGMGAEYFERQVARRLDVPISEIGTAGMKDRHAVTRQMVSAPAWAEANVSKLDGDGIRVLGVNRHNNKLKPGHLHGNRFRILIREVAAETAERLPPLLERLQRDGLPNFYGPQRFGHDGETVRLGLSLLRNEAAPLGRDGRILNARSPFLRKLALSAAQSALFNHHLGRRMTDGRLRLLERGDVMAKWPFGGMFLVDDVAREQERFEARETVPTSPMFGKKVYPAATAEAALRETATLTDAGLTPAAFSAFGKLLAGTRRLNLVYVDELSATVEPDGLRLGFTLPAGSYATMLLREIMHAETDGIEE